MKATYVLFPLLTLTSALPTSQPQTHALVARQTAGSSSGGALISTVGTGVFDLLGDSAKFGGGILGGAADFGGSILKIPFNLLSGIGSQLYSSLSAGLTGGLSGLLGSFLPIRVADDGSFSVARNVDEANFFLPVNGTGYTQ